MGRSSEIENSGVTFLRSPNEPNSPGGGNQCELSEWNQEDGISGNRPAFLPLF
jgi:hypothetical protein